MTASQGFRCLWCKEERAREIQEGKLRNLNFTVVDSDTKEVRWPFALWSFGRLIARVVCHAGDSSERNDYILPFCLMTEAECQNVSMSSGFTFQTGRLFVKHYVRNPYSGNDEEDWLFQDTGMVDRPPASIPSMPCHSAAQDSEQGSSTTAGMSRSSGSPREMSILDEDDQILEIKSSKFYRWSLVRDFFFLLSCVATGGIAIVVCSTWPRLYAKLRYVEVTQCDEAAERVLVESMDGSLTFAHIQWITTKNDEKCWLSASRVRFSADESITNRPRMFIWREERFWYNYQSGSWTRRGFNTDVTYAELHSIASSCALKEIGHDPEENKKSDSRERRSLVYGPNQLTVNVPSLWQLLLLEIFRPFFLFQVFSIIFWICSSYQIYAYVILSLTIVTVLYNLVETRQNLLAVKKLAASECELKRLTLVADETAELRLRPVLVSSSELLPGDIVQVESGMIFPCDLVLLVGQCVVNESMLTGESAPVPKTPLPLGHAAFGQVFRTQSERDGRYKLLSGTKAVQIRGSSNPHASFSSFEMESDTPASIWQFVSPRSTNLDPLAIKEEATPVAAVVISTAYGTAKGQLVRAILFPKPSKYDFEKKLYYFVANLGVYLIFVCIVTIFWQAGRESKIDIFKNCINLITIAVPPALPLALSIGLSVSFTRLQTRGIYCINPNRIINAGRVNTLCFDKTGTLTEDGLSLKGVIPVNCNGTQSIPMLVKCGKLEEDLQALYCQGNQALLPVQGDTSDDKTALSSLGLFYTLAACHSISLLDEPAAESDCEGSTDEIGEKSQGWKEWLCRGRRASGSRRLYTKQRAQDSGLLVRKDDEELNYINRFIGDPLEIQMFSKTGWNHLSRPDDPIMLTEAISDPPIIWTNMHPTVETAIIPPQEVDSHQVLAILRRFDFDSEIRLMSSIVLEMPSSKATFDEARIWVLVKGAPESLQEVCTAESLPQDFTYQLQQLTLSGYRVLACAYRLLGSVTLQQVLVANRSQMETGLIFCGFMAMENKLKAETSGVLLQLAKAGLREVMVTGDNPLTAISVSRQCGPFFLRSSCRTFLIDRAADSHSVLHKSGCILKDVDSERECELDTLFPSCLEVGEVAASPGRESTLGTMGPVNIAVTGRAFSALSVQHDQLMEQYMEESSSKHIKITDCVTPFQMVLTQANIFSRMSPQNKLELMRSLQDLGYVVCMTGDGANDSGALKAADVGISIASKPVESRDIMAAGPSIAAPFSTKLAHIGVVPMVLAEGRCALVNATVMFKYMYFYALIQATSVMVLYKYQLELYEYQYIWADLGLVFPMVLFMPATQPRKELSRGKPESNLLALPILISVYGQSFFIMLLQAMAQVYLQHQSWYENPNDHTHGTHAADEPKFTSDHNQNSTVSFLFSSFQYISMAMALSQSFGMFRCSPFSNIPLIASMICLYVLSSVFMLKPMRFSIKAFSLIDFSEHKSFLYGLWVMAAGNSLLFIIFERYSVNHKSTELDMANTHDEEMEVGHNIRSQSTFHKIMTVLKGEGETCSPFKPVVPDFFRIAKIASPVWARVSNI